MVGVNTEREVFLLCLLSTGNHKLHCLRTFENAIVGLERWFNGLEHTSCSSKGSEAQCGQQGSKRLSLELAFLIYGTHCYIPSSEALTQKTKQPSPGVKSAGTFIVPTPFQNSEKQIPTWMPASSVSRKPLFPRESGISFRCKVVFQGLLLILVSALLVRSMATRDCH
ncbi:hypothetical protein STEG23_011509 [Scotinomys teguina]